MPLSRSRRCRPEAAFGYLQCTDRPNELMIDSSTPSPLLVARSAPICLSYAIGHKEQLAHYELVNGVDPHPAPSYRDEGSTVVASTLGLLLAFKAANVSFLVVLTCLAVSAIVRAVMKYQKHKRVTAAISVALPPEQVRLEVDDSGIRESTNGVESFAPWSAVKDYARLKGTFVITLASGTAAVIPDEELNDGKGQALIDFLKQKSVFERMPSR